MAEAVMTTDLPLPNKRTGKVRDLYDLTLPNGDDGILIVATDRVSVFDVVLQNGIPGKGVMLTQISKFWFDFLDRELDKELDDNFRHHLVSTIAHLPTLYWLTLNRRSRYNFSNLLKTNTA